MTLMTKEEAIEWAKQVVDAHPRTLNDPADLLKNHLPMTYDIASETVDLINKHCELKLSREAIALAGGLHDIGRALRKDQDFHEVLGYWFIKSNGLENGVADSQGEVDNIARIMLPHGSVYETWVTASYVEKREAFLKEQREYVAQFGEINPDNLLPSRLAQSIVDYSELSNSKGKRVAYRERLEEAIERYKKSGDSRTECIIKGSERRIRKADFVNSLREGKFNN